MTMIEMTEGIVGGIKIEETEIVRKATAVSDHQSTRRRRSSKPEEGQLEIEIHEILEVVL